MAIRNTKLGGTDWIAGEALFAADLNDTLTELSDIINTGN